MAVCRTSEPKSIVSHVALCWGFNQEKKCGVRQVAWRECQWQLKSQEDQTVQGCK
jgi:hypothetical protein